MKHLFKKSARGFTLIELLVVIAIIAILSTIVLASLNGARAKAKNARIRSEIANMRAQAELFYSTGDGFTYVGVCGTGTTTNPYTLAALLTSVRKNSKDQIATCLDTDPNGWSVIAPLVGDDDGKLFCADGTGFSGLATAATATKCTPL